MNRKATEKDLPYILPMCEKFWQFTPYNVPFEEEAAIATLSFCLEQNLLVVLDQDGIKGFAAGLVSPLLANHNYLAGVEVAFWIEPGARGRGNGKSLIHYLEHVAREAGIDFWSVASLHSASPEQADKIYRNDGYSPIETTYFKPLKV